MALMSIGDSRSRDRPLTVDDLARMPEDERYRYELVDGRIEMSPAPAHRHSRAQGRLVTHLSNLAPDDIEVEPEAGITLNEARTHQRQPDLVAFSAKDAEDPYLTRPPLLVVEVLSPDSVFRDTDTKRREYAEFGIPSYWIINPSYETPGILELRLDGGEYQSIAEVKGEEVFETDLPFPVRFVPHWLVADGPWRACISGD